MNLSPNGLFLVDKPPGLTSFGIVERVRRWFRVKKVGHTGTLDPFATGLMILCLGKATRLSPYITDWDKEYTGAIRLGVRTDTDDPTGSVVFEGDASGVTIETIESALDDYRGAFEQTPPLFSAKKRDGVPSYRRARRGESVTPSPVQVRIDRLEVVSFEDSVVHFRALCSKGTYMRSLARDLGESLGCGGHLESLRRTAIGRLKVEEAFFLETLKERKDEGIEPFLWSASKILSHWSAVTLDDEGIRKVKYGRDVPVNGLKSEDGGSFKVGEYVRLLGRSDEFLAVGKIVPGRMGLGIHPEKVWVS